MSWRHHKPMVYVLGVAHFAVEDTVHYHQFFLVTHFCASRSEKWKIHYTDVIMTTIASQITSLTVVYSIIYSGVDQRKHQSSCGEFTGTSELFAQRASNAENVSIWWRHHELDSSVQDCSISIALVMEILQSWTKPSTWKIIKREIWSKRGRRYTICSE